MSHSGATTQVPTLHRVLIHKAVKRFMDDLPPTALAMSNRDIEMLDSVGLTREFRQLRHIRDDLWELRVASKKPKLSIRYLFVNEKDGKKITNAFFKKTNQTPQREIDLALSRIQNVDDWAS